MPETPEKQPIPRWLQNAIDRHDNGTYCHPAMAGTKECEGKTPIDCSRLGKKIDDEAGFDVPYMTTQQKHSPKAAEIYHVTEAQKNGVPIQGLDVKPGDTVLFRGHEGRVVYYDPDTRKGKFFGSQSSTGPKVTDFAPGAYKDFQNPDKFLRPKESADPQGILRRNDYVIPSYRTR